MIKTTNECVDCGLQCLGNACPYRNVKRFYCDRCGEEATVYHYDGLHLCIDCIKDDLKEVDGDED